MNMWGSRVATLTNAEGVTDEIKNGTDISGPLTVGGGTIPASTLFWDGWMRGQISCLEHFLLRIFTRFLRSYVKIVLA